MLYAAKGHLGTQQPAGGQVPLLADRLVDQRVVVLQGGANTFLGQGGPDRKLGDPGAMFGPDGEVVGIEGEFLLQILDDGGVLEEQHCAEACAEAAVYLGLALGISLWRYNLFQFSFDDVPQLVVLLAKQDDGTGALGVEGGRAVLDGILDESRQLSLGMGHLVTQGIDGKTYFDLFDKRTAHNISLVVDHHHQHCR